MSSCRTKLTLLQSELYNIDLELALLDDKIEDSASCCYGTYIKDIGNSNYNLEYLIDKKIMLQQKKNNVLYRIKELNNRD
ncbi:hypothetical protein [Clostridium beijerinckii]|uniref:Uncharacterized protein n=1 Tax=Clostridium beijerinckii TaxID=1520 RepID=A0AAE5LNW6_CLOBE|nr:hypothetical protein [Clostridium beijerinckii]ALB44604.1 hypothetical protein X276_04550 [Clostridium beijerinckii NRRL B-598]NSB13043.1 hypothetical protein [Clostridium beijerinckii]OOM22145.1 hypothetical protein CLOBE_44840 [Clostridium beijerinckii]